MFAKLQELDIANILKKQMMLYDFKFGAVFLRVPIDSKSDNNEQNFFTSDTVCLQNFVKGMVTVRGWDNPEDWVGGCFLSEWNDLRKW